MLTHNELWADELNEIKWTIEKKIGTYVQMYTIVLNLHTSCTQSTTAAAANNSHP